MAFTETDLYHINQARKAGLIIGPHDSGQVNCVVVKITLPIQAASVPQQVLTDAITSAARYADGHLLTVWLDVQMAKVPSVVLPAVQGCQEFGVGLVITCNGSSSHMPRTLLNTPLIQAVQSASRDGMVWHPLANSMVRAK